MNEKIGQTFSVAADNAPVPGCTVSREVAHERDGGCVAYFSLAAETDISASRCSRPGV